MLNYFIVHHFLFILNRKIYLFFFIFIYFYFLVSKHRSYPSKEKFKTKFHARGFIKNLYQTYHSLCSTATFIFRLFTFIDKVTREFFAFIEKLVQIIKVIHGWIRMIRSMLSAVHLITSRIMLLSFHVYRIFHLFSILCEPLSNGTFQNTIQSFSHFLFYYYSSNGACYTLKDRTRHFVDRVKERWKGKCNGMNNEDDIYYDVFSEECQ